MKQFIYLRSVLLALTLILVSAAAPLNAHAAETDIVELTATDVILDETRFQYTGQEIRPNVTVRVHDHLLTLDKDYTLSYKDNIEVGTATVAVTGIATSGYTGTVEHAFYIEPKSDPDERPDLIAIVGTDVTIDGTEFTATGEAIEPAVTVTVKGQKLHAGQEYTLSYANNIQPGTASVTVDGISDAGYTGSVTIHFTIKAAEETPGKPEETQPDETRPEESTPEETTPVSYKIIKGNGASWQKNSGKSLSITADGNSKNFSALLIDGKKVNSAYYTVADGSTVITMKSTLMQNLALGKHTVTIQFTDGEATGSFLITAAADDSNPKTGDEFSLHIWTALLFISLTGIIGTAFACRKKSRK